MMNLQQAINNRKRNEQTVVSSALVAKAIVRMDDDSLRVLAVYDQSTRYEFYWIHTTKSKSTRAARKTWTKGQSFPRDFTTEYKPWHDLHSFTDHYTTIHRGTVLSVRVYKARRLAELLIQAAHESCSSDWSFSTAMNSTNPGDYKYIGKKLDGKIKGRDLSGWGH